MINEGENGSISLFYNGILISSFPLTKNNDINDYINQGEDLIRKSKGIPILKQLHLYQTYCDMTYSRKTRNKSIEKNDHILFLACLMALLRLQIIDNDDNNGYLIMPKKKIKIKSKKK